MSNGIDPKIWGPYTWKHIEAVAFGYPNNPNEKEKKHYKRYFKTMGNVLPCIGCRKSYKSFIKDELKLSDEVLKNRKTLVKWVYDLHQKVNKKLGHVYNLSYNDFCKQTCIKYDITITEEEPEPQKGGSYLDLFRL
jgi:hypothetical protein